MMADLKKMKLLFKAKIQPANSSSGQRKGKRHSTKVDGQMYSKYVKITDLVEEYLQTKEKTKMKERL
jgi:hypothetical protein